MFRIAQETLTNIKRHANASTVQVELLGYKSEVKLIIADNGIGFDVAGVSQHPKRGIGLRNMHERVSAVGGKLELTSSNDGTHVVATLPQV
jgi:two-component system NarL family sensor kinase